MGERGTAVQKDYYEKMNSICIATYNGEKYIEEQLHSILSQISEDDEVIISDDSSTDRTLELIESIADPRIKIYHADYHHFKWNFENALRHAGGEIIFLSDQDDVWIEGKYRACLEALKEYDLVCTNSIVVDSELRPLIPDFFKYYHSGKGIIKNSLKNTYFGACLAFKKRVKEAALPFPKTMEIGHDIWIGLVAESIGKVKFIDTPYLLYRRHANALTNVLNNLSNRSSRPFITKVTSRFIVLYNILKFNINKKNNDR